jgi:hypothetical protein
MTFIVEDGVAVTVCRVPSAIQAGTCAVSVASCAIRRATVIFFAPCESWMEPWGMQTSMTARQHQQRFESLLQQHRGIVFKVAGALQPQRGRSR